MTAKLPKLIATSVVRGGKQGEGYGGIFTIDFGKEEVEQRFDWNQSEIELETHAGDCGLRGIAFGGDDILLAASDALFRFDRSFKIKTSSKNRYLSNCDEICRYEQTIFLTSSSFDSLLAFDLRSKTYVWGFHLLRQYDQWAGHTFDPRSDKGPIAVNDYHINMVHVDGTGIYLSGLHTGGLLHLDSKMQVSEVCSLPRGAHNARPYRDGVLFNDTASDCVRYAGRDGSEQVFQVASYDEGELEFMGVDESDDLRQGFGRGLCTVGERFVAGGSSPSTISLYDLHSNQTVGSVNLSMDIRNAIHGLEHWPFEN